MARLTLPAVQGNNGNLSREHLMAKLVALLRTGLGHLRVAVQRVLATTGRDATRALRLALAGMEEAIEDLGLVVDQYGAASALPAVGQQ